MKKRELKIFRGQSLIEVVAAIGILSLIVAASIFGTTVAVRNSNSAKNQVLATKYASETMENTRKARDLDWDSFWQKKGTEENSSIAGTNFSRKIKYEDISGGANDKMKVTAAVSWTDSVGVHKSELVSYFTKSTIWK